MRSSVWSKPERLGGDADDTDEAVAVIVREMRAVPKPQIELLPEAVEILTKAVGVEGGMQGMIHFVRHDIGSVSSSAAWTSSPPTTTGVRRGTKWRSTNCCNAVWSSGAATRFST